MRRRKVDSKLEKQFLTAMIVSKSFLGSVSRVLDPHLIQADHFRMVAEWCLDYFKKYDEAPGKQIESMYHAWTEKENTNPDHADAVGDLLSHLDDQYEHAEDLNVSFLLDEFGKYLSGKHLERLKDNIESSMLSGSLDEAVGLVRAFHGVDLGRGVGVDPLNDRSVWDRAFSNPLEPLIVFPGDAGRFLNHALTRDALIGVQGPEKRGKTWWCLEFVVRSLRNRRRVALFEVGDLSEGQVMLRLGMRWAGMPLRRSQCGDVKVPRALTKLEEEDWIKGDSGKMRVKPTTQIKPCPRPISRRACLRARKRFMRGNGLAKGTPYIKISTHPNSSLNVQGIEAILEQWNHEDQFVPDVIIIDYADILAPEDGKKEGRDQVNDTWKALRRLSQVYHCLVIAPTQADAKSYDVETQSMKNFSEDKRKLAHVTGMLGLNQNGTEKEHGVMRLNWIVLREAEFSSRQCLYVGQCLTLGKAFCCGIL